MKHGSMRHYPSGRKKSYNAWGTSSSSPKKYVPEFEPLVVSADAAPYRRDTVVYKSLEATATVLCNQPEALSRAEKVKISSGYTIAPAYNKGAYQVIPRDLVENIGK
tara:strand:- start:2614 stop:2934 length:321 start_codon:yes stop_codon:yes gene_type:complete